MYSNIEEKVELVEKFARNHPELMIYMKKSTGLALPEDILKEHDEKFVSLVEKFNKCYKHIYIRKNASKLSDEHFYRLKEAGLRGIFGFPSAIEQVLIEYKDKSEKTQNFVVEMIKKYGSMEEFKKQYLYELMNNPYFKEDSDTFIAGIDVSSSNFYINNLGYSHIIRDIFPEENDRFGSMIISSKEIDSALNCLPERYKEILGCKYGLYGVGPLMDKEIAVKMGCSSSHTSFLKANAMKKLKKILIEEGIFEKTNDPVYDKLFLEEFIEEYGITKKTELSQEEIHSVVEIISNYRTRRRANNTLMAWRNSFQAIKRNKQMADDFLKEGEDVFSNQKEDAKEYDFDEDIVITMSSPIEDLGLSHRAFCCLKRAKINTIKDLIQAEVSYGGLTQIESLGETLQLEIKQKFEEVQGQLKMSTHKQKDSIDGLADTKQGMDIPIENFEFSDRTINDLMCVGIYTLSNLFMDVLKSDNDETKLSLKIGNSSYKEIKDAMELLDFDIEKCEINGISIPPLTTEIDSDRIRRFIVDEKYKLSEVYDCRGIVNENIESTSIIEKKQDTKKRSNNNNLTKSNNDDSTICIGCSAIKTEYKTDDELERIIDTIKFLYEEIGKRELELESIKLNLTEKRDKLTDKIEETRAEYFKCVGARKSKKNSEKIQKIYAKLERMYAEESELINHEKNNNKIIKSVKANKQNLEKAANDMCILL